MARFRVRSRHWLEDEDGRVIMGEGRMKILDSIRQTGSMNRTAKELGMSYRGVWARIKATEDSLTYKIVESDHRKGTRLTTAGTDLLSRYEGMKQACVEADNKLFEEWFPTQCCKGLSGDE